MQACVLKVALLGV